MSAIGPEDAAGPGYSAWIGRTETVSEEASRSAAVGLAAVLDRESHLHTVEGSPLFPVGHWLQFTPTAPMSELGADGHPTLGNFMPPLDLPRRMWAGSSIDFHSPILVGETIGRKTTIESITPKEGSSGRLCFVVLRHEISADGRPALTESQTIVYREAFEIEPDSPSPQRPPREATSLPDGWDWSRQRNSNTAVLFRYSALTFNTHRIHYDLPYATEVEQYPGLVVHGPLSATYIVEDFLHRHPGARLETFEFSARAPIFADEQVHVAGREIEPGLEELAVIGPGGFTAITAHIRYTHSSDTNRV